MNGEGAPAGSDNARSESWIDYHPGTPVTASSLQLAIKVNNDWFFLLRAIWFTLLFFSAGTVSFRRRMAALGMEYYHHRYTSFRLSLRLEIYALRLRWIATHDYLLHFDWKATNRGGIGKSLCFATIATTTWIFATLLFVRYWLITLRYVMQLKRFASWAFNHAKDQRDEGAVVRGAH